MPLSPGQVLNNRYRIVKLLGQGGFGAVYRAWDINMEAPCAVKENFDTSHEAVRQFKREATILHKLRHPNLPQVSDHFSIPGQGQYLVMDFVEGEDLGTMLQKIGGPLPESQVLEWASQVCDALVYLHSQNPPIIHRDIKPANIKITPQSKAMLVDFGIAKVYDPNLSTTVGARAITPGYSPQEQYGQGKTDACTDIYALGATLYHLLTGQQPPESVQRNLGVMLTKPRQLNPAVSPQVEVTVLKSLEMLPEKRWQSAAKFKAAISLQRSAVRTLKPTALQTLSSSGLVQASQFSNPQSTIHNIKWLGFAASLGLVGALVVLGVVFAWLGGGTSDPTATSPMIGIRVTTQVALSPTPLIATASNTSTTSSTFTTTPTETRTPMPTGLPGLIKDKKGVLMALIPAGEFLMGSPDSDTDAESDEKPQHRVFLDEYYIDVYEVTNAFYTACVTAGECASPVGGNSSRTHNNYYNSSVFEDYPVVNVDWNQAADYCVWRGSRLPSEAEWEKAARGGLDGSKYLWGDNAPDCYRLNYWGKDGGCVGDTSPVGSYESNGYGLYDMAGNVWEWVQDWYQADYYGSQSIWRNPFGPSSGEHRVLRGGSWNYVARDLRIAVRYMNTPSFGFDYRGFRCASMP